MPDNILGQLGNRVQHALRAFTPRDQKAVKTAAETFVPNPKLNVAEAISKLGTGEALVSTLQDKGVPSPVQQTLVAPPRCRMGAINQAERQQVRNGSPVGGKYDQHLDRESAAEMLAKRATAASVAAEAPPARNDPEAGGFGQSVKDAVFGTKRRQGMIETMAKQTSRTIGTKLGNQILRGIMGSIFGGK